MWYRFLADSVFLIHLAFIIFVVLGATLLTRWPRLLYAHAAALAWGIYIEISGGICPLTPLENHLRQLAGNSGYHGGFVEHYLMPLVYPDELTRTVQFVLAGIVIVINGYWYWRWWRKRHH